MATPNDELKKKAEDMAGRVYIYWRQLVELKETVERAQSVEGHFSAWEQLANSYSNILKKVKEILSIDPKFSSLIGHLKEDNGRGAGGEVTHRVLMYINELIGTLESFIRLYLPPDEKKKIGF